MKYAYAIIRVDEFGPSDDPIEDRMSVKRVMWDKAVAEEEALRLNELNGPKGCRYFVQLTRVEEDG